MVQSSMNHMITNQNITASLENFCEKPNITDFFYLYLRKVFSDMNIFQGSFSNLIFENEEERTIFCIYPDNRFHNLAPKFETLSIPYCVARMFFRTN